MRGEGVYADLLARRFQLAWRRSGFDRRHAPALDSGRFRPPSPPVKAAAPSPQGELF